MVKTTRLKALLALVAAILAVNFPPHPSLAAAPDQLGGSAFPLTFISQNPINGTDEFNQLLQIINAQTVGISTVYTGAVSLPSQGVDTSGVTYSTNVQGNPLQQVNYTNTLVASANTGVALIAGQTGRVIKVTGPITIMASGTAAGATSAQIMCAPSFASGPGKLIETFPIGMLVTNVPAFTSTNGSNVTLGSAFSQGCASGEGIFISNNGTMTTTTNLYTTIPYTVQ